MHSRFRRVVLLLVTLLLLLPVLLACGGGDSNPAATTTATTATAPTQAAAAAATATTVISAATSTTDTTTTPPAASSDQATSTPAPTRTSSVDHRGEEFAFGWNVAMRGDADGAAFNDKTIAAVQDSGFGWVRFQMEWRKVERADGQWDPLPMDRVIDELSAKGVKILVVVAKAPDWALDPTGTQFIADYGQFEQFMAFVANRYKGKVQAWEIWNEENLALEMGGHVRFQDYFELLKAGSMGVRSQDPDAKVVFGGLTPTGVTDPGIGIDDTQFLRAIYQYRSGEIKQYFDILGVHVSSTHNPPDTMWPDNPSDKEGWNEDDSFYFRRAEQLREIMLAVGDDAKPIWITEFGWTTANQAPGYEYGKDNTEEDVANYLVRSFEIMRTEWDFVTGAFVWNLNWSTIAPPEDEKSPWSALNSDWSPRPAYDALKDMLKK